MITKWVKKPVVVQAVLLQDNREAIEFVFNIDMETSLVGMVGTVKHVHEKGGLDVHTRVGYVKAHFGDFIVKDEKGDFHIFMPDEFLRLYSLTVN